MQNIIALEDGRSALKLTTAAYQRPSGKNIHRFPDSKDTDEWGVMPDLGYELGLDERETRALLADRRNRDVITAHATDGKAAAPLRPIDWVTSRPWHPLNRPLLWDLRTTNRWLGEPERLVPHESSRLRNPSPRPWQ